MSEQVDRKLVRYCRKTYQPFVTKVGTGNCSVLCDFCGGAFTTIVEANSLEYGKSLYLCFECEALELLVGRDIANDLYYESWAKPTEGLVKDPDLAMFELTNAEAIRHRKELELPLPATASPETLNAKVAQALAYHNSGFGKNWKIIPSLLSQYADRGTLSPKQRAVLDKFNHSCAKEREQPRRNH